jgi:hypothetical protein
LLAEDGDEKAKNVTVAVCGTGSSHPANNASTILCHGCIVRLDDDDRLFLLSAAHSIVDLTNGHDGDDSKYDIKWSVESSKPIFTGATSIKGIYIPKGYVLDGKPDVGLAELSAAVTTFLPEQPTFGNVSYGDDGSNLVGRTVVGHGSGVFLRGTVVQSSYSPGRILIGTPSISGGSGGCPLFDNSQSLTSFVHGSSKHRASRSFHNNNNNNNDGSDSDSDSVISGFVYADCISNQTTFYAVPSCYFEHLQAAEGIENELAAQPEKEDVYSEHASEYLKTVVGSDATTLAEAMRLLHDIIWPQGADDRITLTSPLEVLHREKE